MSEELEIVPIPEQVLREKLERIAPAIFNAMLFDPSMEDKTYEVTSNRAVKLAAHMIRECERVAREESKKP